MRSEGFIVVPVTIFVIIGECYAFIKITSMGCFTALSLERGEAHWDEGDQALRIILADTRIDRGRKVVYNLPTINIRTGFS